MSSVQIFGPQFSSFVRSVCLCCEEKGINYHVSSDINGQKLSLASPEHLALHPFGKVPVLLHGDVTLFETLSICRYLDAAFAGPALQPETLAARAQVDQWSHALALYADQILVRRYLLEIAFPKGPQGQIRWDHLSQTEPELQRMLQLLAQRLPLREFCCGDSYSLADCIFTPMLDYLEQIPQARALLPEPLLTYIERMRQRPSAAKVLLKVMKM